MLAVFGNVLVQSGYAMLLSSRDEVRNFYDDAADDYNNMMDEEIQLPLYGEVLSNLIQRIGLRHECTNTSF